MLGLHCCVGFSLVAASGVWSLVGDAQVCHCSDFSCGAGAPGLQSLRLNSCSSQAPGHRLSSYGTRAQLLCRTWDPPGAGTEPVSPALALPGGLFSTQPTGMPQPSFLTAVLVPRCCCSLLLSSPIFTNVCLPRVPSPMLLFL